MIKWLKKLFKKQETTESFDVYFEQPPVEYYLVVHTQKNWRYNVRDEKGRFTKKKGK